MVQGPSSRARLLHGVAKEGVNLVASELSFEVEERAPDDPERSSLEPEVTIQVRWMRPGEEELVIELLNTALRRTYTHLGRHIGDPEGPSS